MESSDCDRASGVELELEEAVELDPELELELEVEWLSELVVVPFSF